MTLSGTFGIAVPNFTAYPEMPDIKALVEYGVKMEQMGSTRFGYGITSCSASSRTFRSSNL
jgi:hypothetical protein